MYFTNINNDELQYFKNNIIPFNFSMSLTSILNSSLFHIEDMGNSIYRIYPLFYCNSIVCSDDDNRILNNRCIIAILKNSETFFSFINNPDGSIYDFSNESYYPSYTLEDNLSVEDFNRLVYILRRSTKHYDNLEIKDDTLITSTYGEYTFDLKDSTVSDEGIIITPRTLGNACTVTLTNPVFMNSRYYLHLQVKKINNINLCEDDNNPILTSEIIVPLVRNVPVEIPFIDIELYDVIDFDANVEIVHSEPILLHEARITLTSNVNHIDLGESVTLNAVYDDESTVSDKTIVFKANGTVIGSAVTNNLGVATLTYTPASTGDLSISAEYENSITSNSVNVTVTKLSTVLSLESDVDSSIPSYPINLNGVLEYHDIGLANKTIKIYDNNTLLDTVVTDNTGAFTSSITGTGSDMSLKAVFEGDSTYNTSYSEIILVKDVSDNYMEMNVTNRSFTSYDNNPFTKTGTLLIDWGDNTIEVLNGQMNHNYSSSGHTIKIYGDISSLNINCFRETSSIINIIIPNSVTTIGNYCFYNCTRLTSITLPNNIISLGNYCFSGCDVLTSITLPNNIISLGYNCFLQCTDLTRITLPNSVTSIGDNCFAYCTGLTAIELEWDSSNDIISYKSNWIASCSNFNYFIIPEGTTSLYIAKGYPANLLKEKVDFDGISLTTDKSVLSYADSEYATLEAQLTNEGSSVAVSGETVTFEIRKVSDDSLVETLSDTTDNTGVATVSYSGKGVGDIYIKAICSNITSNTVDIEDCIDYQALTDNSKQSRWTIPSTVAFNEYDNNGWKYGNSSAYTRIIHKTSLTEAFSVEFKVTELSTSMPLIQYIYSNGSTPNAGITYEYGRFVIAGNNVNRTLNVDDTVRIDWENGKVILYINNTKIGESTHNVSFPTNVELHTSTNRYMRIKDFKIKPL